jgi:hypothetical protein
VAIIFYAHLLTPLSFADDIKNEFLHLWKSRVQFPLARLARDPCHTIDAASKREWEKLYPDHPYQVVEFDPASYDAYITGKNALDIHGYRCLSEPCWRNRKARYRIPMADWSEFRLNKARLLCPKCQATFSKSSLFDSRTYAAFSHAAFGVRAFTLWDTPLRQFGPNGFIPTILDLIDSDPEANRAATPAALERYLRFLQLMKNNNPPILVPTLDIDLFWHTHQLNPAAYNAYCRHHIGRPVFHNDSIPSAPRSNAFSNTALAWATHYHEAYLDPSPATPNNTPLLTALSAHRTALTTQSTRLTTFDATHAALHASLLTASTHLATTTTAATAAQRTLTNLHLGATRLQLAARKIRPFAHIPLAGRHPKWEWARFYRTADKQRREELLAQREALVKESEEKRDGEVAVAVAAREAAEGEWGGWRLRWERVVGEREGLVRELEEVVKEREAGVVEVAVRGPRERTAGGGPVWAVVGVEAAVEAPIVAARRGGKAKAVVVGATTTWRDTWVKARKRVPDPCMQAGGWGGEGMAWYTGAWMGPDGGGGGGGYGGDGGGGGSAACGDGGGGGGGGGSGGGGCGGGGSGGGGGGGCGGGGGGCGGG